MSNEQVAMGNEQVAMSNEQLAMSNEQVAMGNAMLYYGHYDVTSYYDRAILTLHKEKDLNLYKAVIYGRPIVVDVNRSCFLRDDEGIAAYGTAALNVSGAYFSEYEINGKPHYEDWVGRELKERIQNKREFTVKTHRGLFNARIGAKVQLAMRNEQLAGKINAFHFRYRKHEAFVAGFRISN